MKARTTHEMGHYDGERFPTGTIVEIEPYAQDDKFWSMTMPDGYVLTVDHLDFEEIEELKLHAHVLTQSRDCDGLFDHHHDMWPREDEDEFDFQNRVLASVATFVVDDDENGIPVPAQGALEAGKRAASSHQASEIRFVQHVPAVAFLRDMGAEHLLP